MYDTHLPYMDEGEPARVKGATLILSRIKALPPGVPFVMTGDFNTGPESEAHTLLTTDLKDARETVANPEGPAETFHNFTGTPDKRIDWILYRGFTALDQQTITTHRGNVYPSDHYPIVADLAFPGGRSEEHTSELQSLMRISYAVFCLKKKKYQNHTTNFPSLLHLTYKEHHTIIKHII